MISVHTCLRYVQEELETSKYLSKQAITDQSLEVLTNARKKSTMSNMKYMASKFKRPEELSEISKGKKG